MRTKARATAVLVAASVAMALAGCSADQVKHATSVGSSVASDVASSVSGLDGDAIKKGMSNLAGGIDGVLDSALRGAGITSDGKLPKGFPTEGVPLMSGTVLGGGAGPNKSGWVVQMRVSSVSDFTGASRLLTTGGYTAVSSRSDSSSAFGLFRNDQYRVVLTFSTSSKGVTATYIVTTR